MIAVIQARSVDYRFNRRELMLTTYSHLLLQKHYGPAHVYFYLVGSKTKAKALTPFLPYTNTVMIPNPLRDSPEYAAQLSAAKYHKQVLFVDRMVCMFRPLPDIFVNTPNFSFAKSNRLICGGTSGISPYKLHTMRDHASHPNGFFTIGVRNVEEKLASRFPAQYARLQNLSEEYRL